MTGKQSQHNPNPYSAGAASGAPQKMLLNKQQVTVGESYAIKGDAQFIAEIEESAHKLAEKKLKQAALDAERIINEAKLEAGKILEEAKIQAQETGAAMIKTAMAEQDDIRETARQAGYQEGYANGERVATEAVESQTITMLTNAQAILESAYRAEKTVLENFQGDALALVRFISQKVLKEAIFEDPGRLVSMIESAIEHLYLTGRIKVVLGETYLETLRQFTPKTQAQVAAMKRFEWSGDALMRADEIHIIANEGAFAIGPEVQIDRLLEPLRDQLPLTPVSPSFTPASDTLPNSMPGLVSKLAEPAPVDENEDKDENKGEKEDEDLASVLFEADTQSGHLTTSETATPSLDEPLAEEAQQQSDTAMGETVDQPSTAIQSWELDDLETVISQSDLSTTANEQFQANEELS